MYRLIAVLLLSAAAMALSPDDFVPCSFQAMTYTHIRSDGVEIATSEDALYHDHDGLWRWDSEFSGLPGLFDSHVWSLIWRPDNDATYHHEMLEGHCFMTRLYPYPFDWVASKFDDFAWTQKDVYYNGEPATQINGKGYSSKFKFSLESNFFFRKNGELVFSNGTIKSTTVDVEFDVDISQFIYHTALSSKLFMTSPPCAATTLPAPASKEFAQTCYVSPTSSSHKGAGVAVKPDVFALVASLLMALLIYIAL